jgi:Mce-associated membrane protein
LSFQELGIEDPDQQSKPARRGPGPRLRALITVVLVPLLVLGVVASGYLAFRLKHPNDEPFNPVSGATSFPSDHDRAQATATAEQFALRMDTISGSKYDAYVKGIEQLLTTKAKTKNKAVFATMSKTYAAAKIQGTGKVLISGITDLDSDSATVLVAHDSSVTSTQGSLVHHYRWTVDLVKVSGKWLVDDFSPVN